MSQRRLGIIFPDYLDPSCSGEVPFSWPWMDIKRWTLECLGDSGPHRWSYPSVVSVANNFTCRLPCRRHLVRYRRQNPSSSTVAMEGVQDHAFLRRNRHRQSKGGTRTQARKLRRRWMRRRLFALQPSARLP